MCGVWLCPKNGEIDKGMYDPWFPGVRQFVSGG